MSHTQDNPTAQIYPATKLTHGISTFSEEALADEAPLQICINDEPFIITMRSPGQDRALAAGFLFSEGIITAEGLRQALWSSRRKEALDSLHIQVPELFVCENLRPSRAVISYASCGICGSEGLPEIDGDPLAVSTPFRADKLQSMFQRLQQQQATFEQTGGCHGAALFSIEGELLSAHEDIGRHNAVDKCIGELVYRSGLAPAEVLLVSGRLSFEIMVKAYHAACPIVAAISAPSSLAVDMGRKVGITVIGFCRNDRATIYSHPEQVLF